MLRNLTNVTPSFGVVSGTGQPGALSLGLVIPSGGASWPAGMTGGKGVSAAKHATGNQ
jgi:hypothetical protein